MALDPAVLERADAAAQKMLSPIQPGPSKELMRQIASEQICGYAITAKPSANLYILLQVSPTQTPI